MTDHPITPPPNLFKQWEGLPRSLAFKEAYRAGADAELEACCEWLSTYGHAYEIGLRAARRPKPPSLKEQALEALDRMDQLPTAEDQSVIRRALEQLDTQAARWGADQEREACVDWIEDCGYHRVREDLRAARRPKPPSLAEQALTSLSHLKIDLRQFGLGSGSNDIHTIRAALERLQELEKGNE